MVDDDADIRDILWQFLEGEGYRPQVARDGREAIESLTGGLPDLMLLDLLMPEVDGYQVLDHLRREGLADLPVLIFSAQRPDPSILRALDSTSRDFIAKPFELDELVIRMQRLLRHSPRPAPESSKLRIYTLGSLRVYQDEIKLFDESWRNKPAKMIFKLLFTRRGQRYPKDTLAEELWPEAPPAVAVNRLRVAVHELRKVLGQRNRGEKTVGPIAQQEGAYFFDTSVPYWSDVDAFERSLQEGRQRALEGDAEGALHAYQSAEAIYQGDYLRDDPFFEWTVPTRERLREAHLSMLADMARLHASTNRPEEAAALCRKILRLEPWREEVYRRLMEYLVEAGRPNEALRAFEECRRALQAEVEASPSPETIALRDRISTQQLASK